MRSNSRKTIAALAYSTALLVAAVTLAVSATPDEGGPRSADYWRSASLDVHTQGHLLQSRHWLDHRATEGERLLLAKAFAAQQEAEHADRAMHQRERVLAHALLAATRRLAARRDALLSHLAGFWFDALRTLPRHDMYITPLEAQRAAAAAATATLMAHHPGGGGQGAAHRARRVAFAALDDFGLLREHLVAVSCRRVDAAPEDASPVCDEAAQAESRRRRRRHHRRDHLHTCTPVEDEVEAEESEAGREAAGSAPEASSTDGGYFAITLQFNRTTTTATTTTTTTAAAAGSAVTGRRFPFRSLVLRKFVPLSLAHMAHDAVDVDGRSLGAADAVGRGSQIDWRHEDVDALMAQWSAGPRRRAQHLADAPRPLPPPGELRGAATGSLFSLFPAHDFFAALPVEHQQELKVRVAAFANDVCMRLAQDPIASFDAFQQEAELGLFIHAQNTGHVHHHTDDEL